MDDFLEETMKLTTLEEYGLRCVVQIARKGEGKSSTIPEIAKREDISPSNTAKVLRLLRRGDVIRSTRGKQGGYVLARPAESISVQDVLDAVGGKFDLGVLCARHGDQRKQCVHKSDCSMMSLWGVLEQLLNGVLTQCRISDLLDTQRIRRWATSRIEPALASSEGAPNVFRTLKGGRHA
jgi:Rrf2 family protein